MVIVALIGLFTACTDAEPPTAATPQDVIAISDEARAAMKERARREHARGEGHLQELAAVIPGFAGLYFSSPSELTVLVKDPAKAAGAADHVRQYLRGTGRQPVNGQWSFRVKQAAYTFEELADWRDAVAEIVPAARDWATLDLDEAANRIVVGVTDQESAAVVARLIKDAGVPDDAFDVAERSGARSTQAILQHYMRPLRGGIAVGPSGCTLNSVVRWGNQFRLLVASHCSATPFGHDAAGPWLQQPVGKTAWGAEVWDSPGYACGVFDRDRCRRADVALFTANPTVDFGEVPFAYGELARPATRIPGLMNTSGGSVPLAARSPRLRIVGVVEAPIQGEVVDKIGWNSGWNYGPVWETCVNPVHHGISGVLLHKFVLVCQQRAEINSNGGDSGGPVFIYLGGDSVLFAGINWGNSGKPGDDSGTDGYFSPVAQMRGDLSQYSLQFFTPAPSNVPYIIGPTSLAVGEWGSWSPSGKHFSCDWWVDDVRVVSAGSCTLNRMFGDAGTHSISVVADGDLIGPLGVAVSGSSSSFSIWNP